MLYSKKVKIGVVGLGYVGLPLAVEFAKYYSVIGYDTSLNRVADLKINIDKTKEVSEEELEASKIVKYTSQVDELSECNVYIVTVPTPITNHKIPDLKPLIEASKMVAEVISKGDIIIYESTVYPGATEEDCIPVVEEHSGLKYNIDFYAGYSPERINPGDKINTIKNIKKVTSGSTEQVADFVDKLYSTIVEAGTFKASSIKVAEASKVIENVQRDVNIALVNEFFQIFSKLGLDTNDIIDTASTKWNFMAFKPGLVGGHCISVDPYYLLNKSLKNGYVPDLIRKSREINDSMPDYLAKDFLAMLIKNEINPINLKVALLGFSFKENCPDIRNTKSYDLYNCLSSLGFDVNIYDNNVDKEEVYDTYKIDVNTSIEEIKEKIAFKAVLHDSFDTIDYDQFDYVYQYK